MQPSRRCRLHGGLTPRGVASANFRHGRYSKAVPALAVRYEAAVNDPDYLALSHEMALLDARIQELVEQPLDAAGWDEIRACIDNRRKLQQAEVRRIYLAQHHLSAQEAMALVGRMAEAVKRHVHDDATLSAIAREFESLMRLGGPS